MSVNKNTLMKTPEASRADISWENTDPTINYVVSYWFVSLHNPPANS